MTILKLTNPTVDPGQDIDLLSKKTDKVKNIPDKLIVAIKVKVEKKITEPTTLTLGVRNVKSNVRSIFATIDVKELSDQNRIFAFHEGGDTFRLQNYLTIFINSTSQIDKHALEFKVLTF